MVQHTLSVYKASSSLSGTTNLSQISSFYKCGSNFKESSSWSFIQTMHSYRYMKKDSPMSTAPHQRNIRKGSPEVGAQGKCLRDRDGSKADKKSSLEKKSHPKLVVLCRWRLSADLRTNTCSPNTTVRDAGPNCWLFLNLAQKPSCV